MTLEITNPSVEEAVDKLLEVLFPEPQPETKSKEGSKSEPLPF